MLVLAIEGEIGAGKSTLLEGVAASLRARGLRVAVAPEPVELWKRRGALQAFYADPPRYAYSFQTYTYVTRLQSLLGALEACPAADVLLTERSPHTDRHVFMELQRHTVTPLEMAMYEDWCGTWLKLLPAELRAARWRAVYLKPTLDDCMQRVRCRAREGETGEAGGVSIDYQRCLRAAHEAYLEGKGRRAFPYMPPSPYLPQDVLVLDGRDVSADFRSGPLADTLAGKIADWALES